MSEIDKLYEKAGVRYINLNTCKIDEAGKNGKCETIFYPEFTAEKQIELIKFLFNHNVYYDVDEKGNYWFQINDDCYTYHYNKFEIALANIINEMWQDLTESEKEEIKRILE